MTATSYLNQLNHQYLTIHRRKEDFFWETYMGISDDHQGSTQAQTQWTNFLAQADKIAEIKQQLQAAEQITDQQEKVRPNTGYRAG